MSWWHKYSYVAKLLLNYKCYGSNVSPMQTTVLAVNQGGDTPYTKARRFLSTCERGHLGLRSIARVIILWENYLNLQRK